MSGKPDKRRAFGTIRPLPSGRYRADYIGPDLQRHKAPYTFADRSYAEGWLASERKLINQDIWQSPDDRRQAAEREAAAPTVIDYARRWIDERQVRESTRTSYRAVMAAHLEPFWADHKVADVTRSDVRRWYQTLDATTPRARSKAYGLLRAIMNGAVDDELIAVSPVHIRGAGTQTRAHKIEPATAAELATIAAAMPDRLRLAVLMSGWCALRYGELAELRRGDIDLNRQVIKVRRAVTWPKGGPVVGTPKTAAGLRDIAIPPHLLPAIRDHLAEHARPGRDGLLFASDTGRQLWASTVFTHFVRARAAAGRPDLRWHDLRHSGAVLAAQSGATVAELQERLGHATPVAAMIYQHAAKGRGAVIAAEMSRLIDGTPK